MAAPLNIGDAQIETRGKFGSPSFHLSRDRAAMVPPPPLKNMLKPHRPCFRPGPPSSPLPEEVEGVEEVILADEARKLRADEAPRRLV